MDSEYLRHQAANCLRLARSTFDLTTAERLRHMASELQAKADDLQDENRLQHHTIGNGFPPNGANRRG